MTACQRARVWIEHGAEHYRSTAPALPGEDVFVVLLRLVLLRCRPVAWAWHAGATIRTSPGAWTH